MEKIAPILRKPTGAIQISNVFTFVERKLQNTLMYHAQTENGLSEEEQDIGMHEVYEALGWPRSKNDEEIKACLRTLIGSVVEWNEFGKDKSTTWTACTFLASGKIAHKRLRYRVNPEIVRQVKRPTLYARMQLLVQGQLKKRHSLVLYEYLQDEIGRSGAKMVDIEGVAIEFLLKLFGLDGETYRQFKYLQRDILKPAVKEINTFSDVSVTYRAVRKGRKTVGVAFTVKREESFQLPLNLDETTTASEFGTAAGTKLIEDLKQQGMSESVAAGLVKKYNAERIQGNIAYLKKELERGKEIQNPGAWLRRAIEQDWRPGKTEAEKKKIEQLKKEQDERMKKKREEEERKELERAFQSFRYKRAEEIFSTKSKSFQTRRRNAFLKKMREEGNGIVLGAHAKDGWESPMVSSCLMAGLLDELLTEEHETSIAGYEAWIKKQGISAGTKKTASAKR